jgi:Immunity protein Imm5
MGSDPMIDQALQVVAAHPEGHLPLALRRRIRARFGPAVGVINGGPSPGLRSCVLLARLSAERVAHHWEAGTEGDDGFGRMLALADEVMAGQIEPEQAELEAARFNLVTGRFLGPAGPLRAGAAGNAAVAIVNLAIAGDYSHLTPDDADDPDVDPDAWEAAYWASLAEALTPDQPDYDPEASRAFWRWYLTVALPTVQSRTSGSS